MLAANFAYGTRPADAAWARQMPPSCPCRFAHIPSSRAPPKARESLVLESASVCCIPLPARRGAGSRPGRAHQIESMQSLFQKTACMVSGRFRRRWSIRTRSLPGLGSTAKPFGGNPALVARRRLTAAVGRAFQCKKISRGREQDTGRSFVIRPLINSPVENRFAPVAAAIEFE